MKRNYLLAFCLAFIIIYNCSPDRKNESSDSPVYGGTLNITCLASLDNLDPQKILFKTDLKIASLIYEGLTKFNEHGPDPAPGLARSWQVLDNGRKIIFKLRNDVYFQNDPCFPNGKGRHLTATDIIYTFSRISEPTINCPNSYLFSDKIASISKIDSLTLEFHLKKPYVSFLKILATPAAFIVPREAVEFYQDNFRQHPVGTGPFRLASWQQLEQLFLVKNDHYWQLDIKGQNLPYLDAVKVKLLSNPVQSISELYKGSLHVLSLKEIYCKRLVDQKDFDQKNLRMIKTPALDLRFFGFSLDTSSTVAVYRELRKAIALCFNRTALLDTTEQDNFLNSTIAPGFLLSGYHQNWYDFNLGKAIQIIKQLPSEVVNRPILISSNFESKELLELHKNIEAAGLKPIIDLHKVDYYPYIFKNRPHLFRTSFRPGYPDPEDYYNLFYSKNTQNSNITGYNNPEFDNLLEHAMVEQNRDQRLAYFKKLENILKMDVPAILLPSATSVYHIMSKNIKGLKIHYNIENYTHVWIGGANAAKN